MTQHVPIRGGGSSRRRCRTDVVDDNVGDDRSKKTALKTTSFRSRRATGKTSRDDELEQSRGALPKNLIRPLPYRITKASGSGDLLSRSPVYAGARDGVDYGGGARHEFWQNLDWFSICAAHAVHDII